MSGKKASGDTASFDAIVEAFEDIASFDESKGHRHLVRTSQRRVV